MYKKHNFKQSQLIAQFKKRLKFFAETSKKFNELLLKFSNHTANKYTRG